MDILSHILILILLVIFCGFFTAAEMAFPAAKDTIRLSVQENKEERRLKRLQKVLEKLAEITHSLRILVVFLCIFMGAFSGISLSSQLCNWLVRSFPTCSPSVLSVMAVLVVAFCLSFFVTIFGLMLPRGIAHHSPEKTALVLLPIVRLFLILTFPLTWLIRNISKLILRIFGIRPKGRLEKVTEENIRMLVDIGSESGNIDAEEKEIIQNVFEFDDLCAGDIATHRTDMAILWADEENEEWEKTIRETHYTRYPICVESVDKIVGILNVRDFLILTDKSRRNVLEHAVKPAYLIPESVKADMLFRNMKEKKEFFAVVLDEYGGTAGIVTMNDLIECLVGEFNSADENDVADSSIQQVSENQWIIRGSVLLSDVQDETGLQFDDDDSDTFSGFVLGLHGTVPDDGSTFEIETDQFLIRVLEIKDHLVEHSELFKKTAVEEDETAFEENKKNKE